MNAIFNVNKPRGITSFAAVAMVRRCSGEKRTGHGGTLDPDAAGVLPVFVGKATRVAEYLLDASKTYRASIEFGITTDTYDFSGKVLARTDASAISVSLVESALGSFLGTIEQTPPMFSALKHAGRPLYQLARSGIEVERKSRPAQVYRISLEEWNAPVATLEIECGRGTYIRSIAHDLGKLTGYGAALKELTRTAYGRFHIDDAVDLSKLEEALRNGTWQGYAHPIDSVLKHMEALTVPSPDEAKVANGRPVEIDSSPSPFQTELRRAYSEDGGFIAILRFTPDSGLWHPVKVFV